MSHFVRFYVTSNKPVGFEDLAAHLAKVDPAYGIDSDGVVTFGGDELAQLEINTPGDGLFDEERAEMIEFLDNAEDRRAAEQVRTELEKATCVVSAQVLFEGRTDQGWDRLDRIWSWLSAERGGLLQVDSDGYYMDKELILELA